MMSVKTHGSLTRGKGFTETPRLLRVLSMPACASINNAMQAFTDVSYETSDQHKNLSKARQTRGVSDTLALLTYLKEKGPFTYNSCLHNIDNGITAQQAVNIEKSREIGCKILESMVGKSLEKFTFRKSDQAVTLASRSTLKIKGERIHRCYYNG